VPKQKLIVGIDPGITSGIAILDIDGRPLRVKTEKGFTRARIIKEIATWGTAVIVACDVARPPDMVKKVASTLQAVLYAPDRDIVVDEKEQIAKEFSKLTGIEVQNAHSRDAICAAVKAYQHYHRKFRRLESEARRMRIDADLGLAKALVVHGNTVKRALDSISESVPERPVPSEGRPATVPARQSSVDEKLRARELRIESLEADNLRLREEVRAFREELEKLRRRMEMERTQEAREVRRERLYEARRIEAENLRAELDKVRRELRSSRERVGFLTGMQRSKSDLVLVKPVHRFTEKGLEGAVRDFAITGGDPVMLLDASGGGSYTAETLAALRPSVVIISNGMSHQARGTLIGKGIAVISAKQIEISWVEGLPYISRGELNKAIRLSGIDRTIRSLEDVEELVRRYRGYGAQEG